MSAFKEIPKHSTDLSDFGTFVSTFAQEMNEWEQAFYEEWSAHTAGYGHEASSEAAAVYVEQDRIIQQSHRERYATVFSKYCTHRKRSHGGPEAPLSACMPPKYQGVGSATFQETKLLNASRAEVTFLTNGPVVNYKFKFVVLRTKLGWLIDGFKYQFRDQEKWNVGIL